ncbi:MAG: S41 family peptidase [Bacteroidales bacterium]|nr:S41 family peptidase [Bacteroidales bacterium]
MDKRVRWSLLFPVFLALAIITGIFIGRFYKDLHTSDTFYIYPRVDKLTNALNYIEREYVDPISKTELIEEAIPKILEGLDPHSQYIPVSALQSVNEPLEGNFTGIGIQFNMLDDTLIVINTIANGPSEKVGILAGDRILIVDDDTVAGVSMPSDSIVKKLRGPKGTKVTVFIQRKNIAELIPFEIIRDNIPLYSVDVAYMIKDDVGYIKISKFSKTTFDEFAQSFKDLKKQGLEKLILDLRNNGGGYMTFAVNIADQFLPGNELIVYTQGNAKGREDYKSNPGGFATDINVAVLIDEGTASSSEILAGALQDNDRGIIIGRRSFGKGLVQEQRQFSDGSALRLTIARYYTPTGRCIQKPYDNGIDEYYNDLNIRYLNGELENEDSIKFSDTLKYYTPEGKVVYGGGGIMPDIFVPFDTTGVTEYLVNVRNKGLIYKYALNYSDENRTKLEKLTEPDDFVKYLKAKNILSKFVAFAKNEGVIPEQQEIATSAEILETQLYAYIARNIIDNKGFYPIMQHIDNTLQKAIEVLSEN